MSLRIRLLTRLLALGTSIATSGAAFGLPRAESSSTGMLKRMSLEELMNVEVTSVSRMREDLQSAAAAITVVSNEDIERSGATSIPEALRHVPGLHVARRNASVWAMGARGFSSSNSEKLLVLSDTRSLYTPLFSGVFWDVQDYLLEDIDRIEVIRGPGAALWGSNAVNGVINITTKNARATQGAHLEAAVGTEEEVDTAARYGGKLGDNTYFRVFAKYAQRDSTEANLGSGSDDWQLTQAGLRSDWDATASDTITIQARAYSGEVGQFAPGVTIIGRAQPSDPLRVDLSGGYVQSRWRHRFDADSELQLRFYYDRTRRDDPTFRDVLDVYDIDLQHSFRLGQAAAFDQEILWGLNYRFTDNANTGKGVFALEPSTSHDSVVSAFIQDQFPLSSAVRLTVGSKFEYNDFSGFEVQPSIRTAWEVTPEASVWGAVSRAVRVPTRLERDVAINLSDDPTANPAARLLGSDDFDSEELLAYELGARWQMRRELFVDIAAFYNRYEGLASMEIGAPFVDPRDGRLIVPIANRNFTDGDSQGIETLLTFVPHSNWRLTASYSYVDLSLDPQGADLNRGEYLEGATPRHLWVLRSFLDLTDALQLDVQLRSASAVRSSPEITTGGGLAGYTELDVRVAWRATEQLQVSVVGQNLLHDRHTEFGSPAARGAIERGVYGKIAWAF
jgi:iron complex outermembrane recepter protein